MGKTKRKKGRNRQENPTGLPSVQELEANNPERDSSVPVSVTGTALPDNITAMLERVFK